MATIHRETAFQLIAGDGRVWEPGEDRTKPTPDNPQAYAVFEFIHSVYGTTCYGVVYTEQHLAAYQLDHRITFIMWTRDGGKRC